MKRTRNHKAIIKRMFLIFIFIVLLLIGILGFRALQVSKQVLSHRTYWEQRAEEAVPQNALWYVALGDSAAQSIGASKPEKGYVGLITNALEQKRPVHVVNLSVTGATTSSLISEQLPKFQQLHLPADAVITLEVGSNNLSTFDSADFRKDIETILSSLPQQTIVADIPYFGGGLRRNLQPAALQASEIIRELTIKHEFLLVELQKSTRAKDSWRIYSGDFFHPSDYGYQVWHEAFKAALEL